MKHSRAYNMIDITEAEEWYLNMLQEHFLILVWHRTLAYETSAELHKMKANWRDNMFQPRLAQPRSP